MLVIPVWLFWVKRPSDGTQIPGRIRQQPSADANMALGHGVHWKWYLLAVPWRTLFGYPMRSWVHQDLGIVPSSQPCKRFSISITSMIIIISCCFLLGRGFLDCLVFTILGFVFVTASIPLRVDIYSQMFDSTTPHKKTVTARADHYCCICSPPCSFLTLSVSAAFTLQFLYKYNHGAHAPFPNLSSCLDVWITFAKTVCGLGSGWKARQGKARRDATLGRNRWTKILGA